MIAKLYSVLSIIARINQVCSVVCWYVPVCMHKPYNIPVTVLQYTVRTIQVNIACDIKNNCPRKLCKGDISVYYNYLHGCMYMFVG